MRRPGQINYNERSWAIDLIGHLKQLSARQHRAVREAGGEQTVNGESSSLFPDVLLFGDQATAVILQGWELKMPDTSIDDHEFKSNAEAKARVLGLDSFVLWNVSYARLYAQSEAGIFVEIERWDELRDITSREDVQRYRARWEAMAARILERVNELLEDGTLEGKQFVESYRSGGVTQLLLRNTDLVAEALKEAARRDAALRSGITLWWQRAEDEYDFDDQYKALAQVNLVNWLGKILFTHVLRGRDARARAIGQIEETATPSDALTLFEAISRDCNFWTIFQRSLGLSVVPNIPWGQLLQFNRLLSDLRVGAISQEQLSHLLEATASVGSRKLRGQYTTPPQLARLLVELCLTNIHGKLLDPCSGSGTIPRAAIEYKLQNEIQAEEIATSVYAGDIDSQAVQLATFALARPELMRQPLRLFNKDAFDLAPDVEIEYRDPSDGTLFTEALGEFQAITSNLPFIANNSGLASYRNAFNRVNGLFGDAGGFSNRADISAYLPFSLHRLLSPGCRLGIIITNSWLGTDWGATFITRLSQFYNLKALITSGAGRWFQNSKVVTNILVMEKPGAGDTVAEQQVKFVVLKRPLSELIDPETLTLTAAQIELGQTQDETLMIRTVQVERLAEFRVFGLAGNAQFVDVDWVRELPLVPVRNSFTIRRGERRGWDKMFYPAEGHGIEADYIRPVLHNSKEIQNYTAEATSEAFSCSRSIAELQELGHTGAIAWIGRFENGVNGTGEALPDSLARAGHQWYEMKADALADLAMPMNYGERLFIARVEPRGFLNQRLIRLNALDGTDIDLCHALLTSTIGMFMIEGIGFGRGQGALDLNKDTVERYMHMLDPARLAQPDAEAIKAAFEPIRHREIMVVADELEQQDRKNLDEVILKTFRIKVPLDRIYKSLLELVSIRLSARQVL